MKQMLLLTAAFIAATSTLQAQIKKGSALLGGGISAGHSKSSSSGTENTSNSFSLAPALGIAVKENTVAGLRLQYGRGKTKYDNAGGADQQLRSYGGGLFLRRYLALGKAFYLFGEGGLGVNYGKTENITPGTFRQTSKQTVAGLSLYPGLAYAVSKRFHLEASINELFSLNYSQNKLETVSNGTTTSSKNSGVAFQTNVSSTAPLTLGFRLVLGQ